MHAHAHWFEQHGCLEGYVVGQDENRLAKARVDGGCILGKATGHARLARISLAKVRVDPYAIADFDAFDLVADFDDDSHELMTKLDVFAP